jgi:hypothetical protein
MRITTLLTTASLVVLNSVVAQEKVSETFSSTRIINGHSNEVLKKKELEFIVAHRFGDVAGSDGGVQNFYGFDNASDVRFAFEYGISDKFMTGIGRSKGTGTPYKSIVDGFLKYKILEQKTKGKMPISLTAVTSGFLSYAKASTDISKVNHYPKFAHRIAYSTQLILAHKFGSRASIALLPTLVHRNYVGTFDQNDMFSIGIAGNIKLTKNWGLIAEYYQNVNEKTATDRSMYHNSLSAGIEWLTNGHTFHFNFTNAKGFGEAQFIPLTDSDWLKGQWRFAFSISRKFKL